MRACRQLNRTSDRTLRKGTIFLKGPYATVQPFNIDVVWVSGQNLTMDVMVINFPYLVV